MGKRYKVLGSNRGNKPRYSYRVWCGGNGKKFITLEGAQAYAEAVFVATGDICAITEIKPRRVK